MLDHWQAIEKRYTQLVQEVSNASLDRNKRGLLQRELSHLTNLRDKRHEAQQALQALHDAQAQVEVEKDAEMKALFEQEVEDLKIDSARKEQELQALMVKPDEHSERSVYLEIRAGTGGQEAALFASDLMSMYSNYALNKGWKVSVESTSLTDLGGIREVVLHIKGKQAYGHLKYESGVHRVQRVPSTETAGRVHTSTATVAVLPEAEEVEVDINPSDLRIDVYRSSGAGGQHVNTTDSAVRITHIPTGVVVTCQDERSQHKNKAKAMKVLQARILAAQVAKATHEMAQKRKDQIGTGGRSEKVRTYNFSQNRVTDHQAEMTLQKLDIVMTGALDEIIDALKLQEARQGKERFLADLVSNIS